jgi:SAM-dependent methyltransferase
MGDSDRVEERDQREPPRFCSSRDARQRAGGTGAGADSAAEHRVGIEETSLVEIVHGVPVASPRVADGRGGQNVDVARPQTGTPHVPDSVLMISLGRAVRRAFETIFEARMYSKMSRTEVFERIYRTNAWGGARGQHYSGRGSGERFAVPHAAAVRAFMIGVGARSVVDLGCGDFRIGSHLVGDHWTYTGVEIVGEVVKANHRRFGSEKVSFVQGDICEGGLPPADVCLVRQVLQHLTNDDIQRLLPHLRAYPYVVVTEHMPTNMAQANVDKPRGPGVRATMGSGVVLHEPPFSWSPGESLLRVPANWRASEILTTTVYKLADRAPIGVADPGHRSDGWGKSSDYRLSDTSGSSRSAGP